MADNRFKIKNGLVVSEGGAEITGSLNAPIITGSLWGTASWASNALTASTVSNLNQNLTITGSVTISGSANPELIVIGDEQITGSLRVTNGVVAQSVSASFTGSLTGGLIGTASWATTASYVTGSIYTAGNLALSASYAVTSSYSLSSSFSQTASFVEFNNVGNKPTLFSGSSQVQLSGISGTTFADTTYTFPGDVVVQGNVTAEQLIISTSVYFVTTSFSSGSTIFGNDTSDTHQFTGSVRITGSLGITGSVNSLGGFTGSLSGTASFANNVVGGYVTSFNTRQGSVTLQSSDISGLGAGIVSSSAQLTPTFLEIVGDNVVSSSVLSAGASQGQVTNTVNGVATTITVTQLGTTGNPQFNNLTASIVSSSQFTGSLFGTASWARNASTASFVTNLNQNLVVTGSVTFSGSSQPELIVIGDQNVTGSLRVSGSVIVTGSVASLGGFTGSLLGTSSWAVSASNSLTASYALNAASANSFPFTGSAVISGSLRIIQSGSIGLTVTGSLRVTGSFTSSLTEGYVWVGGAGNVTTLLSTASFGTTGANRKYTQATPATTWSFNHNLNEVYPVIETYDTTGFSLIPGRIEAVDANNLNVYFDDATAGTVVATVGGIATTNSALSASYAITASYALNGGGGGGGLVSKASAIPAINFVGDPKIGTVVFTTGFADTNYSVVVTGEDSRNWTIENKQTTGFSINSNSNVSLIGNTYWIATSHGETA